MNNQAMQNTPILQLLFPAVAAVTCLALLSPRRKGSMSGQSVAAEMGQAGCPQEIMQKVCEMAQAMEGIVAACILDPHGSVVANSCMWGDQPLPEGVLVEAKGKCPLPVSITKPWGLNPRTLVNVPFQSGDGAAEYSFFAILAGTQKSATKRTPQIIGFVNALANNLRTAHLEAEQDRLNLHDGLTGLPNRTLLHSMIKQLQEANQRFTYLHIDINKLETLNVAYGHETTDKLIKLLAARLKQSIRTCDIAARVGGDEVCAVLKGLTDEDEVAFMVRKIADAMASPYGIDGKYVSLSISIGVRVITAQIPYKDMMGQAVKAMRQAKKAGRNKWAVYTPQMEDAAAETLRIEAELDAAAERGELEIHFQPQVDIQNLTVIAHEALIRWKHPEMGLVPPDKFIPIAEESGKIIELGRWILDQACALASRLHEGTNIKTRVAINVSAVQLRHPGFVDDVKQALERHNISPSLVELEITETAVIQNHEIAALKLKALGELGISIAIDDFGVGHSSLSILKDIPANRIKIDRSFVKGLPGAAHDVAIIRAIIEMSRALNMEVIAEGIETEEQARMILDAGCAEGQGWLYGKPQRISHYL